MKKSEKLEVSGITKNQVAELAAHWEKFAGCYFWSPPGNAAGRRNEEKRHYRHEMFYVDGALVEVKIEVTCSCKNYYCSRDLHVSGARKASGLRFLNKLLDKGTFIGFPCSAE